jgi:hypothetical protein
LRATPLPGGGVHVIPVLPSRKSGGREESTTTGPPPACAGVTPP